MRGQPMYYTDFGGGLNSKAAPYLLEANQCRDCLNVQSLTAGGIVKRDGLVTFATPSTTLMGLYPLEAVGPRLIGTGDTSIFSFDGAGRSTTIRTGLTRNARWEWVQSQVSGGQGPLFGVNGTDSPQYWDGVSASTAVWSAASGSLPNGKYLALHQNYIFMAGTSTNPSRLYWCSVVAGTGTDARSWPTTNVVDLDPNDGDVITGLAKVGTLLLVFKRRKTFAVYDPSTGANRRISDSVGCVSHRSAAETPAGTFFLSESGVYRTNGSTVELMSAPITPLVNTLINTTQAAGTFWNNHFYLSVCTTGTSNNLTLDFDVTLGSWWVHSIGSNQWAVWHPLGVGLYSAKSTSAVIDQAFVPNVATDNGSNFSWYWKGPWLSPAFYRRRISPTPSYRKRLRQVRCDGTGTVDFSIARDFVAAETLRKTGIFATQAGATFGGSGTFGGSTTTFGGGSSVPLARINALGVARAFSPVFSGTSNDQAAVYSMTLFFTDRKD